MISRRTFQTFLMTALGATTLGSLPRLAKAAATPPTATYRYRCRYNMNTGELRMWFRVYAIRDAQAEVPFLMVLSTDDAGKNVISTQRYMTRDSLAHTVRGAVNLIAKGWNPSSELYYQLFFGEERIPSKIWKVIPRA
jgi:hypothetical protein